MHHLLGIFIRRERLARQYSLEGLCRGICAVSYLSRIEQGQVVASDDVIAQLLQRLDAAFMTDPEQLRQAAQAVDRSYALLWAGEPAVIYQAPLLDRAEALRHSPFFPDVILLLDEDRRPLIPYADSLDARQFELYRLLRCRDGEEDPMQFARTASNAFFTISAGAFLNGQGRYPEGIEVLTRGYQFACDEGRVPLMALAKTLLGNIYSNLGQLAMMQAEYAVAERLARALNNTDLLNALHYNTGATLLQYGRAEEAYAQLVQYESSDPLHYHKRALCLEQMGRHEEALETIHRAGSLCDEAMPAPYRAMIGLVHYRLTHPDHLHDVAYEKQLFACFEAVKHLSSGFVAFHVPYVVSFLEANRRYKEAVQLLKSFSTVYVSEAD